MAKTSGGGSGGRGGGGINYASRRAAGSTRLNSLIAQRKVVDNRRFAGTSAQANSARREYDRLTTRIQRLARGVNRATFATNGDRLVRR